jgi:serine/threonine-protein kinase
VTDTVPPVGTPVAPGSQVRVRVSKGRAPITVPNVVGKSLADAKGQLEGLHLVVATTQQDSDKPKDTVLTQNPVDGTGVVPGTTITLTISNGPPAVVVPDVRGMNLDQAVQTLQAAGLQVNAQGFGTVRFQNPGPGTQVPPGTQVDLFAFG